MNIAIVGGGERAARLIEIVETHQFRKVNPRIVALSDPDPEAPAMVMARERQMVATTDFREFFPRDDIDLIIHFTDDMETYYQILDGKKRHVRLISAPTAQLFWEIARVFEQNKYLEKTRQIYETALNEMIQEDVLVIGRDYRIIDANDALLERLGLTREAVVGRTCHAVTHHQDHPCSGEHHPCPLKDTLATGKPSKTTHVHLDNDGRELSYSIHTYPLFDNGEIVGVIENARDITQDVEFQKSMMQHEKLASIGRLSAGVAHEINNPLTTILTSAMLLQEDTAEDDPAYEELTTIANETLRCRKIVQNLLDFARQGSASKKRHDLNDTVKQSVLLTKKQAAFGDIDIVDEYDGGLPPVNIDRGQIQQALINLILNAVEATPPGGRIEVTTRFDEHRRHAYVHVRDTGAGIPPADMDKVFEPFFTRKESGTGLGLAITHGIIEQHGGAIDVCSHEEKGTEFTIRLPVPDTDS